MALSIGLAGQHRLTMMWVYGVAGAGGVSRTDRDGHAGTPRAVLRVVPRVCREGITAGCRRERIAFDRLARPTFFLWLVGTLMLAWGLPTGNVVAIRVAAVSLLGGVGTGAAYIGYMLQRARSSGDRLPPADSCLVSSVASLARRRLERPSIDDHGAAPCRCGRWRPCPIGS